MSLLIKVDLVLNVSLLHIKIYLCMCIYIICIYIFDSWGKNRKYPFLFITGFT